MAAKPKHILLVEDQDIDAMALETELLNCGITLAVTRVENAEGAVRYFQGENEYSDRTRFPIPALVFIDLMLGKMNGFELIHWLRQHYLGLMIVVVSSLDDVPAVKKAYEAGADYYLAKPVRSPELINLLRHFETRLGHLPKPDGAS